MDLIATTGKEFPAEVLWKGRNAVQPTSFSHHLQDKCATEGSIGM